MTALLALLVAAVAAVSAAPTHPDFAAEHAQVGPSDPVPLPNLIGLKPKWPGYTEVVSLNLTDGGLSPQMYLPALLGTDEPLHLRGDLVAYDAKSATIFYMAQVNLTTEWHNSIFQVTSVGVRSTTLQYTKGPIDGIAFLDQLYALSVEPSATPMDKDLVLYSIDLQTGAFTEVLRSQPQPFFTLVRWLEPSSTTVHVLVGDKYAHTPAPATLFSYNVKSKNVTSVLLNTTKYFVSGFNVIDDKLYASSCGPYSMNISLPAWSIVQIETTTGAITPLWQIVGEGMFHPSMQQNVHFATADTIFISMQEVEADSNKGPAKPKHADPNAEKRVGGTWNDDTIFGDDDWWYRRYVVLAVQIPTRKLFDRVVSSVSSPAYLAGWVGPQVPPPAPTV